MYIDRDIDKTFLEWKHETSRKPLLVRGVRQCGKTSSVRNLAKTFKYYVEINLDKNISLHRLFENDINVDTIISQLELFSQTRIQDGQTLLFIDEIQKCPRAITALRYFQEERADLHVIAAGSLLEFFIGGEENIEFPVGRVTNIFMYPLSFVEYLTAKGLGNLRERLESDIASVGEIGHGMLIDLYKEFLIVGGMPEAVNMYLNSGSFLDCQKVHRSIMTSFRDDFSKYSKKVSAEVLNSVFDFYLHNICNQITTANAVPELSYYKFQIAANLLHKAGIAFPVHASDCQSLPLGSGEKRAQMKVILFDTGVYLTLLGLDTADIIASSTFERINKGTVVEMMTGLELLKSQNRYSEASLFYWYRTGANAEIDYVIQKGEQIVPVEAKSNTTGKMQSMRSYLNTHPNAPYGIRVSLEEYSLKDKIHIYPVYASGQILKVRE